MSTLAFRATALKSGTILTYVAAIVLLMVLVVGAFNPGCLNEDTLDQWAQAGAGTFHDWHPATLSIIWRFLRRIYDGFQIALVFQIVLFSLGVLLTVRVCRNHLVRACLLIGMGLVMPIFVYLGFVGSDSVLASLLVFAVGLFYTYKERQSKSAFWGALFASYVAYAVRPNSIFAVIPFLALLLLERSKRSRAALLLVLLVISFLGAERLTRIAFRVRHEYPAQACFLFDLSALSLNLNKVLIPVAFQTPYTSLTSIREQLNVYNASPLFFSQHQACALFITDPAANRHLAAAWMQMIVHHPLAFAHWRFQVFWAFLGLEATELQPYVETCMVPNAQHLTVIPSRFHLWVMGRLAPFAQTVVFRPYSYFLILFVIAIFGLWRKRRDIFLIASAGFCYTLGYFLVSPGGVFRYVCCCVFLAVLLIARVLAEWIQTRYLVRERAVTTLTRGQLIGANLLFVAVGFVAVRGAEAVPQQTSEDAAVVRNGDFETGGTAPWAVFQSVQASISSSTAHTGTHSLDESAGTGSLYQDVTGLRPGSSYMISAWVFGSTMPQGTATAQLAVWDPTANTADFSNQISSRGTWTRLTKPFTAGGAGTVRIHLFRTGGVGPLYWDDVRILSLR